MADPAFIRRQKERERADRAREKAQKREQRRQEKATRRDHAPDEDPDLAGIVPGPQPPIEDEA